MPTPILSDFDFGSVSRVLNLPQGTAAGHPVTFEQVNTLIEGLKWKTDVVASTASNVNISAPGTTVDGVTMSSGNRFLLRGQTNSSQNGIYVWNGSATPASRALDANTVLELTQAVVSVQQGSTSANTSWRQTQVGFVLDTDPVVWTAFGTVAPTASESTAGIAAIATQTQVNTGTDNTTIVTPQKLAAYTGFNRKVSGTIGNGSATSFVVTHNLNTYDVTTEVYALATGGKVTTDVGRNSVNAVTVGFSAAPASNSYRVVVTG
jgi:hypothetical protein